MTTRSQEIHRTLPRSQRDSIEPAAAGHPRGRRSTPGIAATLLGSIAITTAAWFAWQPGAKRIELPCVVVDVPVSETEVAGVQAVLDGKSMDDLARELTGVQQRLAAIGDTAGDGDRASSVDAGNDDAFRKTFKRDMRDGAEHFLIAADLLDADAMVRNATFNPRDIRIADSTIDLLREVTRIHKERIRIVREARATAQARAVETLARQDGLHRLSDARKHLSAEDAQRIDDQARQLAEKHGLPVDRVRIGLETDLIAEAIDADASFYFGGEAYFAPRGSVKPQLSEYDDCRDFLAIEMLGDVLAVFMHAGALHNEEAVQAYERVMARTGKGARGV